MAANRLSRRLFATGAAVAATALAVPGVVAAQTPVSTRSTSGVTGESVLQSLLAMTPNLLGKESNVPRETRFSNLLSHYSHFGLAPLNSNRDPIDPRIPAMFQFGGVPQDSSFIALEPEHWLELLGFHPFTIHAMLDQRPIDDYFLLLQGAFEKEAVFGAWERTGYALTQDSSNIWHLNLDNDTRFDLAFDNGLFGFLGSSYDYAAYIDETTVVLASHHDYIEQAQQASSLSSQVTTGDPAITSLTMSMPNDLSRAFMLPGQSLKERGSWTNPNLSPTQREEMRRHLKSISDEYGRTPSIKAAILGRTPGGPYRGDSLAILDSSQRATYVAAIALSDRRQSHTYLEIATQRFDVLYSVGLRQRYWDLMTLESAQVIDGGIVLMTFTQKGNDSHDLFDFYYAQDLQFLYW
ncbi:MAG: hypothetical protein M3440_00460 [Chloroflexota bacterium]|nr:hypothetical protein [Chloroflexota bacterium]